MIAEIGSQLRQYQELIQTNGPLQRVLEHPGVTVQAKVTIVTDILARVQPTSLLRNFILLLVERDRLRQLDAICLHYERMSNDELRRVVAQVTSATEMNAVQRQTITEKIAAATHKEVQLETRIDPSLLGGLIVRVNNVILDGSVRGQLARLRKELIGG